MQPERWREGCDPFALNCHTFRPTEILGYPHAGNDVFYLRGEYQGRQVSAYLKAARHQDAAIAREVDILRQLDAPWAPRLIDWDLGGPPFCVTLELPGRRLSAILGENEDMASLGYMRAYGRMLAQIHGMKIDAPDVAERRFHRAPPAQMLDRLGLRHLAEWFQRKPERGRTVFCHGDFHYANLLWQGGQISGVLDFELAGYGDRDFDIAWALILRPGQKFLKTKEERALFLEGYGECNLQAVQFWMAQIYVYFLDFSGDDPDYCAYVRAWLDENCK